MWMDSGGILKAYGKDIQIGKFLFLERLLEGKIADCFR
jgi:hypothetical protein